MDLARYQPNLIASGEILA